MHVPALAAALVLIATPALAQVGRVEVVGKPGVRCTLNGQSQTIGANSRALFDAVAVGPHTLRCGARGAVAGPVMVRANRTARTSMATLRRHMLKARKKTATPDIIDRPVRRRPPANPQSPSVESTGSSETSGTGMDRMANDRRWQRMPGKAVAIATFGADHAWVLGTNRVSGGQGIYRWTSTSWQPVIGGAVDIAIGPSGRPWVINEAREIYRYNGRLWDKMPGLGRDIAVGADGSVWLIGTNAVPGGYGIYRWNGRNWSAVAGGAEHISVGPNGLAWVVNTEHQIFRFTGQSWVHVPGKAREVSVGADGSVWGLSLDAVSGGLQVQRLRDGAFEPVLGGLTHIAAASRTQAWGVNRDFEIYRLP